MGKGTATRGCAGEESKNDPSSSLSEGSNTSGGKRIAANEPGSAYMPVNMSNESSNEEAGVKTSGSVDAESGDTDLLCLLLALVENPGSICLSDRYRAARLALTRWRSVQTSAGIDGSTASSSKTPPAEETARLREPRKWRFVKATQPICLRINLNQSSIERVDIPTVLAHVRFRELGG